MIGSPQLLVSTLLQPDQKIDYTSMGGRRTNDSVVVYAALQVNTAALCLVHQKLGRTRMSWQSVPRGE